MSKVSGDLEHLLNELLAIREAVYRDGNTLYDVWKGNISRPEFLPSAQNLAYYMALRKHDLRDLQERLIPWGLSSLGRLESRVLGTLDSVIKTLSTCVRRDIKEIDYHSKEAFELGGKLLRENTTSAFGKEPAERYTRIMVTLATEAAENYKFVKKLMENGMDVARINCAHDNSYLWKQMIEHIHRAEKELGKKCKILMDVAGPKIRIDRMLTTMTDPKVNVGDRIFLTGRKELYNFYDISIVISCNIPEIIDCINEGEIVRIDDGQVEGLVETKKAEGVIVKINKVVKQSGVKMRTEKGINFPGVHFKIDILTKKDKQDMDFICEYADIIGGSFVKDVDDIRVLQNAMEKRLDEKKLKTIGLMAKVETLEAIKIFPQILVAGAGRSPFTVMIARGDLAVEAGYERLSELQEEILWMSEAAHIPVVWATQVLESLVKTGIPTRAEITDIAMGARAECVMLNKGDYIHDAVAVLDDVLKKFKGHQHKKTSRLRALRIAENLWR
ncbi:MAG: pyruvate kinase [Negativicutes bacterium]